MSASPFAAAPPARARLLARRGASRPADPPPRRLPSRFTRVVTAASGGESVPGAPGLRAIWSIDARYGHKANALEMLGEWVHTVGVAAGLDPADVSLVTGAVGVPESNIQMEIRGFANVADIDAFFARIPGGDHRRWGERFAPHVVDGSPVWRIVRCVPVRPPLNTTTTGGGGDTTERVVAASGGGSGLVIVDEDADGLDAAGVIARALADSSGSRVTSSFETREPRVRPRAPRRASGAAFVGVETYEADAFGDAPAGALVFPKTKNQKTKKDEAMDDEADDDEAEAAGDGGEEGGIDLSEYPPGSKVVRDWKGDPMVITPGDKLPFVS